MLYARPEVQQRIMTFQWRKRKYYALLIIILGNSLNTPHDLEANSVAKDKFGLKLFPSVRANEVDAINNLAKGCRVNLLDQVNLIQVV